MDRDMAQTMVHRYACRVVVVIVVVVVVVVQWTVNARR